MENYLIGEDVVQDAKRYKKMKWGYLAKAYSKDEENVFYKEISKNIFKKYGDLISEKEAFEILSKRGKIYTIDPKNIKGFYELKTGNIGIPHFLNRITTTLLHECVHKIGFEKNDVSFRNMSPVFKEAGTELVTSRTMDDKEGKEFLFGNVWSKLPCKVDDSFLSVCIVNQLNEAVGDNLLEKSILQGKDFFKPAIIKKYGENKYVFLKEKLEDLVREEKRYWGMYSYYSDDEKSEEENKMFQEVKLLEDFILKAEFDDRINNVVDHKSGLDFLESLKSFGLNRSKTKEVDENGEIVFSDDSFSKYFFDCKGMIENKFGKTNVNFDENEWQHLYENKETLNEVSDEEKREVLNQSIMFQKTYISNSIISKIKNKLFGTGKKALEKGNSEMTNERVEKSIEFPKYEVNTDKIHQKNVKRELEKNVREK